jgi:hypothetical protein
VAPASRARAGQKRRHYSRFQHHYAICMLAGRQLTAAQDAACTLNGETLLQKWQSAGHPRLPAPPLDFHAGICCYGLAALQLFGPRYPQYGSVQAEYLALQGRKGRGGSEQLRGWNSGVVGGGSGGGDGLLCWSSA